MILKNGNLLKIDTSSKTPLLQTSKKLTKSPLLQTSKNWEIAEKKIVRNFLDKIKFLIFFEFFSENVLKIFLRGRETTRKKYRIVFEKFLKYVIFFDFGCPSPITTHHPSPPITHHHPSSVNIKNCGGQKWADTACKLKVKKVHLG